MTVKNIWFTERSSYEKHNFGLSRPKKTYTLLTDASMYVWSAVLTQEYTTSIDGKTGSHQLLITYVSGLFQGSQLNWDVLTKEAYAIYMSVKKLSF